MGGRSGCRRGQRRIPVDMACWLIVDDEIVCYRSFDISATGIAVRSTRPLPPGTIVELQFFLPTSAHPASVTAQVVWCSDDDCSMGLTFLERDRTLLDRLLAVAVKS